MPTIANYVRQPDIFYPTLSTSCSAIQPGTKLSNNISTRSKTFHSYLRRAGPISLIMYVHEITTACAITNLATKSMYSSVATRRKFVLDSKYVGQENPTSISTTFPNKDIMFTAPFPRTTLLSSRHILTKISDKIATSQTTIHYQAILLLYW